MELPWFAWIAVIAIIGGITLTIVQRILDSRREIATINAEAARDTAAAAHSQAQLVERLDAIDSRLGAIERTLTEIP